MRCPPLLESQNKGNDGTHRQRNIQRIYLQEHLLTVRLDGLYRAGEVKEDQDCSHSQRPYRYIDIETPAPGRSIRECAAEERPRGCS